MLTTESAQTCYQLSSTWLLCNHGNLSATLSLQPSLQLLLHSRVQIAPNSSLVTCLKCCTLGNSGPVTCLQACAGCLLAGNAQGQLARFAQQPGSSIWLEDKRMSLGGGLTTLTVNDTASQAVVGTNLGSIW